VAAIFSVDGFDFWTYTRVNQGEGLAPSDPDILQAEFGQTGGIEGDPLISLAAGNREFILPVTLTPLKTATFTDDKDGLNGLLADVNRRLAVAKVLEWREDGATVSSYFNVLFARFEPDYDYRRAGALRVNGTIRVTCSPYSSTGTQRIAATAAGTGPTLEAALASVAGDRDALLDVAVRVGSQIPGDGRITGVAVVPTGYLHTWPAASITLQGNAARVGASGAAGSQAITATTTTGETAIGVVHLSPASTYEGRNRLFALTRRGVGFTQVRARDQEGRPLEAPRAATVYQAAGWGTVDLGVLAVDSTRNPTVSVYLTQEQRAEISHLLVFPEDRLAITVDTPRKPLGRDEQLFGGIDDYGSAWTVPSVAVATRLPLAITGSLYWGAPASSALFVGAAQLGHPSTADLNIESAGGAVGLTPGATAGVALGKVGGGVGFFARLGYVGTLPVLNLLYGGVGAPGFSASIIASRNASGITDGDLRFRAQGPVLSAAVFFRGTLFASIGASAADAAFAGQAAYGAYTSGAVEVAFRAIDVEYLPSVAINPADQVEYVGSGAVVRKTSASAFTGRLDSKTAGRVPLAKPHASQPERVVALHLPLDGGSTDGVIGVDVRVTERFLYHRA
jgi:hypothetical protein